MEGKLEPRTWNRVHSTAMLPLPPATLPLTRQVLKEQEIRRSLSALAWATLVMVVHKQYCKVTNAWLLQNGLMLLYDCIFYERGSALRDAQILACVRSECLRFGSRPGKLSPTCLRDRWNYNKLVCEWYNTDAPICLPLQALNNPHTQHQMAFMISLENRVHSASH